MPRDYHRDDPQLEHEIILERQRLGHYDRPHEMATWVVWSGILAFLWVPVLFAPWPFGAVLVALGIVYGLAVLLEEGPHAP